MPAPLTIAFAAGSSLVREHDRHSDLPILRNGPPGTFVRLGDVRISLPTDQIVMSDERADRVSIGFGGMRFVGMTGGRLTFQRVRDLRPEHELSPDRSWTMTLEAHWVASVREDGRHVWPMPADDLAGLCATCSHTRLITSSRGSGFYLCQRSATDPAFLRYPPLPMRSCPGYEPGNEPPRQG